MEAVWGGTPIVVCATGSETERVVMRILTIAMNLRLNQIFSTRWLWMSMLCRDHDDRFHNMFINLTKHDELLMSCDDRRFYGGVGSRGAGFVRVMRGTRWWWVVDVTTEHGMCTLVELMQCGLCAEIPLFEVGADRPEDSVVAVAFHAHSYPQPDGTLRRRAAERAVKTQEKRVRVLRLRSYRCSTAPETQRDNKLPKNMSTLPQSTRLCRERSQAPCTCHTPWHETRGFL